MDIIGLAAVVPVIGLVINPELIHENEYLARAFQWTSHVGIDTERKFLMFTSIALIAAFLFKALVNLGLNLIQTRYSFAIGHRISGLMWQYHFSQSLERMRSTESGRVLAEINGWPFSLANTFVVGNLRFINELMVIRPLLLGCYVYEPIVLLSVGYFAHRWRESSSAKAPRTAWKVTVRFKNRRTSNRHSDQQCRARISWR